MRNVVTVLGCLLLLCNTVKTKDECRTGQICSQRNCKLMVKKENIVCDDCETDDFDFNDFCALFNATHRLVPCSGPAAARFFIANTCKTNEGDQNGNTTIVIVVCVSVVVVVLAVLLTGVYCWRVRRGSNGRRKAEDVELRNNARSNDAYKGDNEPFSSRPGSTYNTIDDLQRDHEYHTLEPQNSMRTHVESNQQTVYSVVNRKPIQPGAKGDSDGSNAYNDGEYNRINYNKRQEATSDPSYSHLGSIEHESDYNTSEADTISKTSAYNYGVPIKIKDPPNTKPADTKTRPMIKVPNGADDDYVIPKRDLEEHPHISGEKPKAIVNPLNFNENGGYSSRNSEDNSAEVTIDDMKKEPVATKYHGTDGYEEARIAKVESTGNTDNEITKIELPRVQIGKTTEDKQNDGYETAAIKQTKTTANDIMNDSDTVNDMQMNMTDLNSSGS